MNTAMVNPLQSQNLNRSYLIMIVKTVGMCQKSKATGKKLLAQCELKEQGTFLLVEVMGFFSFSFMSWWQLFACGKQGI